jgi:glutaminyl-tRNA synthetase
MDEAPDSHQDKDFMEFINPNSLKTIEAFVEPSLKNAKVGERFQFQRLGYFNVDDDSSSEKLIFNKTVGLRDSWAKVKPQENTGKQNNQNQQKPNQQPKRKAIDVIQQLGKKYTNLPEAKQQKAKAEIQELAKDVSYEELEPLFNTAVKKVGTRIAVMITLEVLLKNGLKNNSDIQDFIAKALEDTNDLLVAEASKV